MTKVFATACSVGKSAVQKRCDREGNVSLPTLGLVTAVGSPTDRKSLYAHTFLFAAEFRLDAAMVNLILTNYIFTQLFQKIKT